MPFVLVSEAESHLYAALDQEYSGGEQFDRIYQQAVTVGELIPGSIRQLKDSNH